MRLNKYILGLGLASLCWVAGISPGHTQNLQASLLADIKSAQQKLSGLEQSIGSERGRLGKQLNAMELEVAELRRQAAVARRLADENTLSLSQLRERLDDWREQESYQLNLVSRFLNTHGQSLFDSESELLQTTASQTSAQQNVVQQLKQLTAASLSLGHKLHPQWQQQDVVTGSGEIQTAKVLHIGPVHWYRTQAESDSQLGLAENSDGLLHAAFAFGGNRAQGLQGLLDSGRGAVTFDPSLNRAIAVNQNRESAIEHIAKGGIWVVPILLFALFALAIAIAKAVQLWRLPRVAAVSSQQLQDLLAAPKNTLENDVVRRAIAGMQRRLLTIAITTAKSRARDDQLFVELQNHKSRLEHWIGAIAVTASVSPLLGLLGTVSGMIETFKMMTLFGSGDPEVVSGGIAQALVTTELGLVVAIPALVLNAVLSRRAKIYYGQLENFALQLSQSESTETRKSSQTLTQTPTGDSMVYA